MKEDRRKEYSEFKLACIFAIILVVSGVLLGALGHWMYSKRVPVVPIVKPDITKELNKIDSLTYIVDIQDKKIEELEEKLREKKVIIVKEIEKIKEMPADENVELMTENLIKYGELTEESDSLRPQLITLPEEDSVMVIMSENNMKDVNIIAAKYQNELEVNEILTERIEADSLIIDSQNSIIEQSSIIINKNEEAYNINMKSLQASLEKERKEKKQAKIKVGILGTLAGVFAVTTSALLITK